MQVWPQGAWFGLTRKRLRWIAAASLVLILLAAITAIGLYSYVHYQAYRARRLLQELQSLELGKSSFDDAKKLYERYPPRFVSQFPCTRQDCDFWLSVDTFGFVRIIGDTGILSYVGIRPWDVTGSAYVKNGLVVSTSAAVRVHRHDHGWVAGSWKSYAALPELDRRLNSEFFERDSFYVHWFHLHMGMETGEGIEATVTAVASPDDRQAAFHFETSCLTRIGSCLSFCELMPEAARYYDYLIQRQLGDGANKRKPRCTPASKR